MLTLKQYTKGRSIRLMFSDRTEFPPQCVNRFVVEFIANSCNTFCAHIADCIGTEVHTRYTPMVCTVRGIIFLILQRHVVGNFNAVTALIHDTRETTVIHVLYSCE